MKVHERLDPDTLQLLKDALDHHPEFLDIWARLEAGLPEQDVDMELSVKANSAFSDREDHGTY